MLRNTVITTSLLLFSMPIELAAQPTFSPQIERVRKKIKAANRCVAKSNCELIKVQKCPYGCDILVHQSQVKVVEKLISSAPAACEFKCPNAEYFKNREIACEQRKCVWADPNAKRKATPSELQNLKAGQKLLERIYKLRQHVRKFAGHESRLRSELEPIERRIRDGKKPLTSDYATLTKLERKYRIFEATK